MDWKEGASEGFKTSADNAKLTGQDLGEFIIDSNIDPNRVHCIGHGLGELFYLKAQIVNNYLNFLLQRSSFLWICRKIFKYLRTKNMI